MKTYEVTYREYTYAGQGDQIAVNRTKVFETKTDLKQWLATTRREILAVYEITTKMIDLSEL